MSPTRAPLARFFLPAAIPLALQLAACQPQPDPSSPTTTDDACPAASLTQWYLDQDEDGYGTDSQSVSACDAPDGYAAAGGDCDDANAEVHPGAEEICNQIDDDCDGNGDVMLTWYVDSDDDGYGVPEDPVEACERPNGYTGTSDDCNDDDPDINPGVPDLCNGADDNCNGDVDEDAMTDWQLVSIDHETSTIWQINRSDGSETLLAPLVNAGPAEIPTMDTRGDGVSVVYDAYGYALNDIDVCAGTLAPKGPAYAGTVCGISFGPNGDLYGMDNDADVLLRFDMNTGASTIVGSLGLSIGACGLAYDCKNDVLYGADAATDTLFTLNPVTGTATQVIATTVPFKAVGLAYEPATGLLLAATDDAFYELDPITGAGTLLGFFDPNNHINDLALYPPCP